MCIYALKEVINYYRKLDSTIFVCFLDLKRAFGRVSYRRLIRDLIDCRVSLYLLQILKYWHESQLLYVGWGSCRSSLYGMGNGIRQWSFISSYLFNVYVDQLNVRLNETKFGCQVVGTPTNNFAYADDITLLAPTARALNSLLNVCEVFVKVNYMMFNTVKLECIFSPALRPATFVPPKVYLYHTVFKICDKFQILGAHYHTESI